MKSEFAVLARVPAQQGAPLGGELREIFPQIDAMPMRRGETRAKQENGIPFTTP
jgi:hypothetical protein